MSPTAPDNQVAQQLNLAVAFHQQGKLQEALAAYQRVLTLEPDNFTALHYAGILFGQLGRFEEALHHFTQAGLVQPRDFAVHYNRGKALQELKRYPEALRSFDEAISLNPGYAAAHNNRGNVLESLQRFDEALLSYDKAIAINANFADAYHNRGNVLMALARYDDALASFNRALALDPGNIYSRNSRGLILLEVLNRPDEALANFSAALSLNPGYAEAYYNSGNALKELGRDQEALASFDKAIALNPDFAEAYFSRGVLLNAKGKLEQALKCFAKAISIKPDDARARYNCGILKLLLGDFSEGWVNYEWRWKNAPFKDHAKSFKQPLWLGDQSLAGKTILVHAEQGLGDVIQFVRYVELLEARGAKVLLAVPPVLESLIKTVSPSVRVFAKWDALPEFDLHCPVMSLPLAFNTTLESIPARIPYLHADPEKQAGWRERLGSKSKPRIGLAWSGSVVHTNDRNRSIPLHFMAPLRRLDFEYHSLQKEVRQSDRSALAQFQIQDHATALTDFSDTAALISELDLVVTVDTSVAHLAGALGKPVWILLPYVPDFRWLTGRADSPWYPTARLFRQESIGDWNGVIEKVYAALAEKYSRGH